jgi:hypothetical protein
MIIFHAYSAKWYEPFGAIIKAKSNAKFNHVSIEIVGVGIYQANAGKGVTKIQKQIKKPVISIEIPFDAETKKGKDYIDFLDAQIGKKYDYKAIIFGFWGRKNENGGKWYCSELTDTFFSVFLNKKSVLKTNISPKVFISKAEAYLLGLGINEK